MDLEEKILSSLSTTYTNDISINKLSKNLKKRGFDGDYKNTYQKIKYLENQGLIKTKLIGKSRIIQINYSNPATIAKLAIIELEKKINFLNKNPDFQPINIQLNKIESDSITLIEAEKNFSLNRLETLIITTQSEKAIIKCKQIEKSFNTRIDCLALTKTEFAKIINTPTITEMLSRRTILSNQEQFINLISELIQHIEEKEYTLTNLDENELRYNLAQLGYSEFGKETKGKKLSIEETITSTLLNGTARQKTALKKIIKNNDFSLRLLYFLIKKYSIQQELKNIDPTNNKIKQLKKMFEAIKWLKIMYQKKNY